MQTILSIVTGSLFPFFMTVIGAAAVFFVRENTHMVLQRIFLGFAAGVMLAASIWSLLTPAIEGAQLLGIPAWLPTGIGICVGSLFLLISDLAIKQITNGDPEPASDNMVEKNNRRRAILLHFAMSIHNIPEGIAVGLSFSIALQNKDPLAFSTATALAVGIGIQNFPEGAAVALPLYSSGSTKARAFIQGCLSGIVEPIFCLLTITIFRNAEPFMPWMLSFAAGTMLYVIAEELIPEANHESSSFVGTLSIMLGFLLMMLLDIGLS